jgi:hypothetical protein
MILYYFSISAINKIYNSIVMLIAYSLHVDAGS